MSKLVNYIPKFHYKSINEISFSKIKELNKKVILFDLDNTLLPYHLNELDEEAKIFLNNLEKSFLVVFISNSTKKRVEKALDGQFNFIAFALKPLQRGFRKAMKKFNFKAEDAMMIGDQILTDICGANKANIDTILVDALEKKTEKFYTRYNRYREKKVFKKLSTRYPDIFEQRIINYYEL